MKAECEEALQDIQRFLDGEIGEPLRGSIDSHLHECPPCMQRADFQRHLKELIASRCGCDEVPAALQAKVRNLLDEASPALPPER